MKNESVPLDSRWISETEWRAVLNYRPYADYDIPLLLFGDFHSVRKTEQNKFLLDVSQVTVIVGNFMSSVAITLV